MHPLTFDFTSVPKIIFGRGRIARIGELAATFGRAALVVCNGGGPESGAGGIVAELLEKAKVRAVFHRQRGEPQVADVDAAVRAAQLNTCELVIGLGGGSAIDLAKAAAGILGNGGSALDYMEVIGRALPLNRPAMPWIAVPTTAGTGAEATRNAVIGFHEKHFKASLRSENLYPRIALIDAELAVDVPRDVTARCGMDALCQVMESYTSTGAQPMTDALAIQGIRLAARSLKRAYDNGADLDAREDMAMAALLSGITLTNAGLGAVHGFAAPLGALHPIPHGTVCAALLPHVIAANVAALRTQSPAHPTLARYAEMGRIVSGHPNLDDARGIEACEKFTSDLTRDLHIPRLREFGFGEAHIAEVLPLARKSSSMKFNPVVLTDEALAAALRKAM